MCPVCKKPMMILELDGIEVDHCAACLGTWLDAGELEALVHSAEDAAAQALTAAIQTAERLGKSRERQCPRCRRRLEARRLREPEVTFDVCPHGDGLWLDSGELGLLVKAFASSPGATAGFLGTLFERELAQRQSNQVEPPDRAKGDDA